MGRKLWIGLLLAAVPGALADIIVYENDVTGWHDAVADLPVSLIDWDDVEAPESGYVTIEPDHYAGMPAGPVLTPDAGSDLYLINPGDYCYADFDPPVSEENVFSLEGNCPEGDWSGVLTVEFETPVLAFASYFLDVEGQYASTGLAVNDELYAFSGEQGNNSQAFLGIVADTPFDTLQVHLASARPDPGSLDAIALDDTAYAVPEPTVLMLFAAGTLLLVRRWGRARRF
jgi:hypothetical protein